jgi:hypothetical protein
MATRVNVKKGAAEISKQATKDAAGTSVAGTNTTSSQYSRSQKHRLRGSSGKHSTRPCSGHVNNPDYRRIRLFRKVIRPPGQRLSEAGPGADALRQQGGWSIWSMAAVLLCRHSLAASSCYGIEFQGWGIPESSGGPEWRLTDLRRGTATWRRQSENRLAIDSRHLS